MSIFFVGLLLHFCFVYVHVGLWMEVRSSGTRPPPCDSFSLTMIDPQRALLFGGKKEKFSKQYFNHVYFLDLELLVSVHCVSFMFQCMLSNCLFL